MSQEKREGGDDAAGRRLGRLPSGRHGLSREFVSRNQRDRIAAGIIAAVAEHGYREATIARITAAAGVSRRAFYYYFSSKDEGFFATYDLISDHLRQAATAAGRPHAEWPERLRARLAAVLEVFAANPDLARFVLVVPPRAGDEIAARYRRAIGEVVAELLGDLPPELEDSRPSPTAEEALVGGAASLIVEWVEAGKGERLPELLPDLLEFALTPMLGREAAVRFARTAS